MIGPNKLGVIGAAALAVGLSATASAQEITLRFGLQGAVGSETYEGAKRAAEMMEELSDGRITMEIFPASQLGDFREMMEQVTMGDLDITLNPFGGMDPWIPRAGIVGNGYVIRDFDHLQKVIAGEWGQAVLDEMREDFNWRTLDSWYFGTRHTTANKPIETIEDFKGLRLRVPNARTLLDFAEAMGAAPTPVAFAEVYLALQTNQVDGQENPLPTIDAMKFYEVQDYISLTGHVVVDQLVLMNEDTWQSLSAEDQGIVQTAILAGGEENDRIVNEGEANLLAFFEEEGLTVIEPDVGPMRAAMQPVYDALNEQFGEGTVEAIMAVE